MIRKYNKIIISIFAFIFVLCLKQNIYANTLVNRMNIDTPLNNSQIFNTDIEIDGWALNGSGVKEVDIYLDNTKIGPATYGASRPDVNNVYPGYENGTNSGFNYTINRENVRSGYHTIKVTAIGNDGFSTSDSREILMIKPNLMNIDTPSNNYQVIDTDVQIDGWALNGSGVKEAEIYLDGTKIGQASYGADRPDVYSTYPGYENGSACGFNYTITKDSVSSGTHIIKVIVIGNDNTSTTDSRDITMIKKSNIMNIDIPSNYSQVNNSDIQVGGWALNGSRVKQIDVYLDGNKLGQAIYGANRPDVDSVYPGYKDGSECGFNYTITKESITSGKHIIKVMAIGIDSSCTTDSREITMVKKSNRMNIDSPLNNSQIKNTDIQIGGWALNGSGVKQVDVYLDDIKIGQAVYGGSRSDVNSVYPGYDCGVDSGFNYTIYRENIRSGYHTIKITVIGIDGSSTTNSRVFLMLKPNLMNVDTPVSNSQIANTDIQIDGWALNGSGVKVSDVYLDGIKLGQASYGANRPDVYSVYPGYENGSYCGFNYTINRNDIVPGNHTIKVTVIGNDGSSTTNSRVINMIKNPNMISIDTPSNNSQITNENLQIAGWALNGSGVKEIDINLDGNYIGSPAYGESRTDVDNAFPGYENGANSGFDFNFDSTKYKNGSHVITVYVKGYDGTCVSMSIIVNFLHNSESNYYYTKTLDQASSEEAALGAKISVNGSWVNASVSQVEQYLDPVSLINDARGKLEFLKLDYHVCDLVSNITVINNFLSTEGTLAGKGSSFLEAAQKYNINLFYLISHSMIETGHGKYATFTYNGTTVYNMFGIAAYDDSAYYSASAYAYKHGWTTPEAAILGGAKWISENYIHNSTYNQNTLYKMRWNIENDQHQYATDVRWAYNITYYIKKLSDLYSNDVTIYDIPVYK